MTRRREANRRDGRRDMGPCRVCKGPPFPCWQDEINHLLWGRRQVFTLSLPGTTGKVSLCRSEGMMKVRLELLGQKVVAAW